MKILKSCTHELRANRILNTFSVSNLLRTPFEVVLYHAVTEEFCEGCGASLAHTFPHVEELISIVAVLRSCDSQKLNGADIKFLRRSIGQKAKELAEGMDISAEQLSRYENDVNPINESYEKLLRLAVCTAHRNLTASVNVHPEEVLNMKIRSARDAGYHLQFDLVYKAVDIAGSGSSTPELETTRAHYQCGSLDNDQKIAL